MYKIKYSEETVKQSIRKKAMELKEDGIITDKTVFLVMLNGGAWFASHLFDTLTDVTNEVYFVKAHSYNGSQRTSVEWDLRPSPGIENRDVVVLDDICDSGNTVNAIYQALKPLTSHICVFTLLHRAGSKLDDGVELYSCIEDDSEDFFVGCGLDDYGKSRMLPFIGIIDK